MRVKGGKYLLFLATLCIFCATMFLSCSDDEEPDYYFSVNANTESKETASSLEIEDSISIESSSTTEQASSDDLSDSSSVLDGSGDSIASSIESSEACSSESFESSVEESSTISSVDSDTDSSVKIPSCGDLTHDNGDWPVEHVFMTISEQPTCLRSGYSRTFCTGCDLQLEYEFYPALGHKSVTLPGFESTCCTKGATESKYCERCLVVLDEPEELPFIDHLYVEGCCLWCDLTELKFETIKRDFQEEYAVCTGPVNIARRVIIPAEVTLRDKKGITYTYIVKEIAPLAFAEHHELYSVEIGENIEVIGEGAFELCFNMKEVYDKSKTQVTKGGLEKDGDLSRHVKAEDFHYEPYQSKVTYSETGCIIYTDGDDVILIGCRNTHTTVIIPEGVTYIESHVFEHCYYVTEVIIASTVQYIERLAFYYECDTHEDDIKNHLTCKNPIKHITFKNPDGWYVGIYQSHQDPMKMGYDISEPLEAWYQLVVLRDRYWIQEELLLNPTI